MDLIEAEQKKIRNDLILIENDYYQKMDRLIKKRLPQEAKEDESHTNEAKTLNTPLPFKFI